MESINHLARPFLLPERKHRRFSLQYPVRLKIHSAASMSDESISSESTSAESISSESMFEFDAVSRNISIGGLLLETPCMIPQHTPVSFVMTVRSDQMPRPIQFVGEGKVLRVDVKAAEEVFAIAVECKRPITRIDERRAGTRG